MANLKDVKWTKGDTPKKQGVYIIAVETCGIASSSASYWSPVEGWTNIAPNDEVRGFIRLENVVKQLPYFWEDDGEGY
ncbi:hypothetical protein ACJJIK_13855 [Microbulbifer sp. ZKSA006]|uniref:hypothetical protein n=1 Tax=Microbulbifer sp. ZKSA006 TaxID=3243390 RepID=UPI00403A1A31